MENIYSCAFNTDTACMEVHFKDGRRQIIDCCAVEDSFADTPAQRAELDYLLYNHPAEYAGMVLYGDVRAYLKAAALHAKIQ